MKHTIRADAVMPIVRQVVALARPQRILLFGSGSRNSLRPDSDLDFLVVVANDVSPTDVVDLLNTRVRRGQYPCDFLVTTPAILKKHRRNPGLVYGQILAEGVEVYSR